MTRLRSISLDRETSSPMMLPEVKGFEATLVDLDTTESKPDKPDEATNSKKPNKPKMKSVSWATQLEHVKVFSKHPDDVSKKSQSEHTHNLFPFSMYQPAQ